MWGVWEESRQSTKTRHKCSFLELQSKDNLIGPTKLSILWTNFFKNIPHQPKALFPICTNLGENYQAALNSNHRAGTKVCISGFTEAPVAQMYTGLYWRPSDYIYQIWLNILIKIYPNRKTCTNMQIYIYIWRFLLQIFEKQKHKSVKDWLSKFW